MRTLTGVSKGLRIGLLVAGIVGLATGAMAWFQVDQERRIDEEDMERRAHALAYQLSRSVQGALALPDAEARAALIDDLQGYRRLIGFAVLRADGRVLAVGKGVTAFIDELQGPGSRALRDNADVFTFVILGAPSRTHIRRYRDLIAELESLADEINWKFQTDDWKPLRFLTGHHDAATVYTFMRMASVWIVSALHDGMNLVAKEYVAAKEDGEGVLILSEFAGAARELSDALIINPYDTEQFADAIRYAIEMDPEERRGRMERMRRLVEEHNVYRWAASLLAELAATRSPDSRSHPFIASTNSHALRGTVLEKR